jgi:hypothetical protein
VKHGDFRANDYRVPKWRALAVDFRQRGVFSGKAHSFYNRAIIAKEDQLHLAVKKMDRFGFAGVPMRLDVGIATEGNYHFMNGVRDLGVKAHTCAAQRCVAGRFDQCGYVGRLNDGYRPAWIESARAHGELRFPVELTHRRHDILNVLLREFLVDGQAEKTLLKRFGP